MGSIYPVLHFQGAGKFRVVKVKRAPGRRVSLPLFYPPPPPLHITSVFSPFTARRSRSAVLSIQKKGVPSAVVWTIHRWCLDHAVRDLRNKWELLNLTLTLQLTLTLTEEINKHLHIKIMRLCEIVHAQWHGCELFGTASYLMQHYFLICTVTLLRLCGLRNSSAILVTLKNDWH